MTRTAAIRTALAAAFLVLGSFADRASAGWQLIRRRIEPGFDRPAPQLCVALLGVLGEARAQVHAFPSVVVGLGSASDASFNCAPQSAAVATGLREETWRHKAPGQGSVEMWGEVRIKGRVDLLDADCAAAALGMTELTYGLGSQPFTTIRAELGKSVAQTSQGLLGTVNTSGSGPGFSIPFSVGLGEGTYPDEDHDETTGVECPCKSFYLKHRTHGSILVWANAGLLNAYAECAAREVGTVSTLAFLDTVLQCP
ncbi:MAG TPA: hypothetical protein VFI25_16035 [Planctomycetota bacterium]|jgi:hypothetical protein|nr:hypothetical protein [Planctomycetota bacterium]